MLKLRQEFKYLLAKQGETAGFLETRSQDATCKPLVISLELPLPVDEDLAVSMLGAQSRQRLILYVQSLLNLQSCLST